MSRNSKIITLLSLATVLVLTASYYLNLFDNNQPEIKFQIIGLGERNLSDYRGQVVVLNFWATTCPLCMEEIPKLIELYNKYQPSGLALIAVAMPYDQPQHVADTVKQRQIPYPVAIDIDGHAVQAVGGIRATPSWVLLDRRGRIHFKGSGKIDSIRLSSRIEKLLTIQHSDQEKKDAMG